MGRWLTPDWSARPATVPYANFGDPQSLNLYLYVRNDPVSKADADGHVCDLCEKLKNLVSGNGWNTNQQIQPPPNPPPPPPPGPPPMTGVNPVTGQTLFSANPKGEPGHERPGEGGAGNFGASRGGGTRSHQGEDISGPVGADVHASTGGTVTFSGVNGSLKTGYGNTVKIDDGNGTTTVYSHNTTNSVSVGDTVKRGDVIGTLGQTGNAAGQPAAESHVHFEVIVDGKRVDPAQWLNSAVSPK
jgi:murein DD-endopeptidase MepM/ murein hydrolase activator NlpD